MRNMSRIKLAGPVLLAVGLLFAVPASAQMGSGMMSGGKGDTGKMQMGGILHDMADHMGSLSGKMSNGNLSKAQQKQMAEQMRDMATMLGDMSGMMGKGMMMNNGQMGKMRKQMDKMMK